MDNNIKEIEKERAILFKTFKFRLTISSLVYPVCLFIALIIKDFIIGFLESIADALSLNREDRRDFLTLAPALVFMISTAAFIIWVEAPYRTYRKLIKKDILPSILSMFGNFQYEMNKSIDDVWVERYPFLPEFGQKFGSDLIYGGVENNDFKFSKVRLLKQLPAENDYRPDLFNGYVIALENTDFDFFETVVFYNQNKLLEFFKKKKYGIERVKIPYPKFEKSFDAYSRNQVSARELLDPVLISNIVDLNISFGGRSSTLYFNKNYVLIFIYSKKEFFKAPPFYKKIKGKQDFRRIYNEMKALTSISETLQLKRKQKNNAPL